MTHFGKLDNSVDAIASDFAMQLVAEGDYDYNELYDNYRADPYDDKICEVVDGAICDALDGGWLLSDNDIEILYQAADVADLIDSQMYGGGGYEFWSDFRDLVVDYIGKALYGE